MEKKMENQMESRKYIGLTSLAVIGPQRSWDLASGPQALMHQGFRVLGFWVQG